MLLCWNVAASVAAGYFLGRWLKARADLEGKPKKGAKVLENLTVELSCDNTDALAKIAAVQAAAAQLSETMAKILEQEAKHLQLRSMH